MRRFFTAPENVDRENMTVKIIEDADHIRRVLRMEKGDTIIVFDGTGREYAAQLDRFEEKIIYARIISETDSAYEPNIRVTLYQGLPKAGKLDLIVQKAVELGVYEIVPFKAERSVVKIASEKSGERKTERLNKISLSAAKQCGRGIIPAVRTPVSLDEMSVRLAENDINIMMYEELGHAGTKNLRTALSKKYKKIGLIIGPEGGFSDTEAERLTAEPSVVAAGLGKRILRTETAAITALSVVMYEMGEI